MQNTRQYVQFFTAVIITLCTFPVTTWAVDFSVERAGTWETFKQLHIEGYKQYPTYGLVFDAASCNTQSNDSCDYAVSEGAGYGLLIAAIQKDQATFDKILHKTFEVMWVPDRQAFGWKAYTDGSVPDKNAATDGDEDVAMALIMADTLQKNGTWKANSEYREKAQRIINSIYETMTLEGGYLCPGNYACTTQELNFSYFSPAWYRIFDQYEDKNHDWQKVINKQYDLLLSVAKQNGGKGLIPDWCTESGGVTYNGRPHNMTYDAIRVPWRIGIDSMWFNEPRAKEYLDMILPYILQKSGVADVKMYSIPSGDPIEWHNQLSVAMWMAGAYGSNISQSQKDALANELRSMYSPTDKAFNARWAPEKWYYYNQALAILGAAAADGSLANPLASQSTSPNTSTPSQPATPTTPTEDTKSNSSSSDNTKNDSSSSKSNKLYVYENSVKQTTLYVKKGKIAKKHIVVKVRKKYDSYTVRVWKQSAKKQSLSRRNAAFHMKYTNDTPLKNIRIHKRRVQMIHADKSRTTIHIGQKLQLLSFTQIQ